MFPKWHHQKRIRDLQQDPIVQKSHRNSHQRNLFATYVKGHFRRRHGEVWRLWNLVHYTCAGVSSFVAETEWYCSSCIQDKNICYSEISDSILIPAVSIVITSSTDTTRASISSIYKTLPSMIQGKYILTTSPSPTSQNDTNSVFIHDAPSTYSNTPAKRPNLSRTHLLASLL